MTWKVFLAALAAFIIAGCGSGGGASSTSDAVVTEGADAGANDQVISSGGNSANDKISTISDSIVKKFGTPPSVGQNQ